MTKTKLELMWIDKDKDILVEPRVLVENKENSNIGFDANTKNMLVHGDNLLALQALMPDFEGKIKCIYIDPPYNTGSAFEHYDDNLEHSIWLNLMRKRIELLRQLLSKDGSIWISIDDDERDYLKVLCDEIFGRTNFVTSVIWQKKGSRSNDARWFSDNHDYILVYAKDKQNWIINKLTRGDGIPKGYSNPDNDPRGPWTSTIMSAKSGSEALLYEITTPSGRKVLPPSGRFWSCSPQTFEKWKSENRIWFGPQGDSAPRKKTFLCDVQDGLVPLTVWTRDEVGDNQEAKKEVKQVNDDDVFATPKPERLIERVIQLASNPGDWVLDSFLGSGTTCSVAHKMGRNWIGIELGKHCYTHSKKRIDMVIANKLNNVVSKNNNWQGGGGYRFYELAPTLIKEDAFGQKIINPEYNPELLAATIAKHEGYKYEPDKDIFWKQANNGLNSYLYVTTNHINKQIIESIKTELKPDEYLLISCKSFDENSNEGEKNIEIKKIPQSVLEDCEYDRNDYSLNVIEKSSEDDE